jgi:hypothetical protein
MSWPHATPTVRSSSRPGRSGCPGPTLALGGPIGLGPVADVDGDGRGDVVAPSREWWKLHVLYVDAPCIQTLELEGPAENLAAGDLDGDGKADIVAGSGASVWISRTRP